MVKGTLFGWTVFTRTEAVTMLTLIVASTWGDPTQFALHSGRTRVGRGSWRPKVSPTCKIHLAGKGKCRASRAYLREAGKGANALAQPQNM